MRGCMRASVSVPLLRSWQAALPLSLLTPRRRAFQLLGLQERWGLGCPAPHLLPFPSPL